MRTLTLVAWFAVYSSCAWGVMRFFRRDGALTSQARAVALFGALFGIWHLWSITAGGVSALRYAASTTMMAGALALFWSAVRACRSRPLTAIFSDDLPLHLVAHGPYRHIRHPFYAAYSLFWFAGALASDSLLGMVPPVMMVVIYVRAARQEEAKFARSPIATAYRQYRSSTGFITPRLPGRRPA